MATGGGGVNEPGRIPDPRIAEDMEPRDIIELTRRDFLVNAARGVGGLAFASLLAKEGLLAANAETSGPELNPLAPKPPHFAAKARRCIFIYMEGGVSQLDLFDP